jgi:muramoyltetrapeptide carboxypeptidase
MHPNRNKMIKIPPYLKKGDTIGITCPAGFMEKEKAKVCIETLQKWGLNVMVGKTLGSNSANYFSGTDEERTNELQAMLDDKSIHAILCGRGGYGVGRIIDKIDFSGFKKNPKWIIGYSDITILHCHLFSKLKTASLHAPMASAFNEDIGSNKYIHSLQKALFGKKTAYPFNPYHLNKKGSVNGELVGGNLALFSHLIGSSSESDTKDKILFLEDIGEYIYNVDRMFYQLKRSGKLKDLAGLIVGQFSDMKDTDRPFGKSVYEVIDEIVKEYDYPVCYNFPVGHCKENFALKVGIEFSLTIGKKTCSLKENQKVIL